ncbi:hypothetical protein TNCT_508451 [Trichonephila clavata]|uniref:Uncharacterized protein n=1 Tax=Trichonephila clavata TaxID=2740835 RepID=A0A8X6G9P8_TRICU|nr:hypothetical protein TNCT_508451 [Trichonephila clavata]
MIITYTKMLENYDQVNDNIMEVLNKSLADTSRKKEEMMMTYGPYPLYTLCDLSDLLLLLRSTFEQNLAFGGFLLSNRGKSAKFKLYPMSNIPKITC